MQPSPTSTLGFAHLHVHSEHSKLDSTARVGDLIRRAAQMGQPAVAITDHGTLEALYAAHHLGRHHGVKVISGLEAYVAVSREGGFGDRFDPQSRLVPVSAADADGGGSFEDVEQYGPDGEPLLEPVLDSRGQQVFQEVEEDGQVRRVPRTRPVTRPMRREFYDHLTLLALNERGHRNLVAMHNLSWDSMWRGKPRIDLSLLRKRGKGILVLTGCLGGPVVGPLARGDEPAARRAIEDLIGAVGADHVAVEVMEHGIAAESAIMPRLAELAYEYGLPLVATNDLHYVREEDSVAHEAWLVKGRSGVTLATPPGTGAGRRWTFPGTGYHMRSESEMRSLRPEGWWQEACDNTVRIAAAAAEWVLPEPKFRMPSFPVPEGFSDEQAFHDHLLLEGAKERYGQGEDKVVPKEVTDRIERELDVIRAFHAEPFNLHKWYIHDWARKNGIVTGFGRGCLRGDVPVWTPGGFKPIKEIRVGDHVRTHTGAVRRVTRTFRYDCEEPLVRVEAGSSGFVTMTSDHKVLTIREGHEEWVPACGIHVGEHLVRQGRYGRTLVRATAVEHVSAAGEVFDIEVAEDHSFMTRAFVVHNSAASSAVSYCLGIVHDDPLRHDLLFERYMDRKRGSVEYEVDGVKFDMGVPEMPDIDSDFASSGLPRVLAHMVERYGPYKVMRIGSHQTSATKASVKTAARLLGYSLTTAQNLADAIPVQEGKPWPFARLDAEAGAGARPFWAEVERAGAVDVVELARKFEGVVAGPGIHASGVLVADEDVLEILPTRLDVRGGQVQAMRVTEWEHFAVQAMGFLKLDFLGLRNLDIVETCVASIAARTGEKIDHLHLPDPDDLSDPRVVAAWSVIARGHTSGLFQMESEGMTRLATAVRPVSMEEISALVALYRPGPLEAGMDTEYAERKHGRSPVDYSFLTSDPGEQEVLRQVLAPTHGLLVYQEGWMHLGDKVAGFSPEQRTALRKAVSKKRPEVLAALRVQFVEGAQKDVHYDGTPKQPFSAETAERVYDMMAGGGSYAFNKCVPSFCLLMDGSRQEIEVGTLYRRLHGEMPEDPDLCHFCHQNPARPTSRGGRCKQCASWLTEFNDARGFYLLARCEDGRLRPQRVKDVHWAGFQETYRITLADGHTVQATAHHRFGTPDGGYIRVSDMIPGQTRLAVDGGSTALREWTETTVEAAACDECGRTREQGRLERAHLGGDHTNQEQEVALVGASTVVAVEPAGVECVYDVEMVEGSDHNFLADGVVSHNSHSVSYGHMAFVTAYLKANYPADFAAAVLACTDGDDKRLPVLRSIGAEGITVLPPDVNRSGVGATAVDDSTITLGLGDIKGVASAASLIVRERSDVGPFTGLGDLMDRVETKEPGDGRFTSASVDHLIEAGALDAFGPRKGLMAASSPARFRPDAPVPDMEWGILARAAREQSRLGLIIGEHPLTRLAPQLAAWHPDLIDPETGQNAGHKVVPLEQVARQDSGTVVTIGLVTSWKESVTRSGAIKAEATLSGPGCVVACLVLPHVVRGMEEKPRVGSIVAVLGRVEVEHAYNPNEDPDAERDAQTEVFARRKILVSQLWSPPVQDVGGRELTGEPVMDISGLLFDLTPFAPLPPGQGSAPEEPPSQAEVRGAAPEQAGRGAARPSDGAADSAASWWQDGPLGVDAPPPPEPRALDASVFPHHPVKDASAFPHHPVKDASAFPHHGELDGVGSAEVTLTRPVSPAQERALLPEHAGARQAQTAPASAAREQEPAPAAPAAEDARCGEAPAMVARPLHALPAPQPAHGRELSLWGGPVAMSEAALVLLDQADGVSAQMHRDYPFCDLPVELDRTSEHLRMYRIAARRSSAPALLLIVHPDDRPCAVVPRHADPYDGTWQPTSSSTWSRFHPNDMATWEAEAYGHPRLHVVQAGA